MNPLFSSTNKSYRLQLDRSYKEIFWTRHNTNFFWKPLLTRIHCFFTFSHAEKQFLFVRMEVLLTVLLICCILKARNCKNIHRNTYSTNRDIYCKTIVAFSECFFKQLQNGQKSYLLEYLHILFCDFYTICYNVLSVYNLVQIICCYVYRNIKNSPYCIIDHHSLPKGSEICNKDNYWIPRRAKINILHEQFDILLVS